MAAEASTLWFGLKFSGFRVNSKFVHGQSTDQICSLLSKEIADGLLIEKVFAMLYASELLESQPSNL